MQRYDRRQFHNDAIRDLKNPVEPVPKLEPVAAVGDPPGNEEGGNCGRQAPPQGQHKIGEQAEDRKGHPEDFPFHNVIVVRAGGGRQQGFRASTFVIWGLCYRVVA
jgi:hypothetical protein